MTAVKLSSARFKPVVEFRGGSEWPGPPVATEAEAVEALRGMVNTAGHRARGTRIDVDGSLVVPLRDLVAP